MQNLWKKRNSSVLTIFTCGVVFVLFLGLNHFTPMHADDYDYSFSFAGTGRISSLQDVFYSQMAHYVKQNGRISTLGLAQILLMLDQNVIDVVLSLFFVLLGVLIAYHIEGAFKKINCIELILIYSMLFLFTPSIGQSYLWTNSASIYLGGVLFILIYLIPYRKVLENRSEGKCQKKGLVSEVFLFVWMLICGFLAGNAGENMSVGVSASVIAYLAVFAIKKIKIRPWMLGIGSFLGLFALLISPGNHRRVDSVGGINLLAVPKRFILVTALFLDKMQFFIIAISVVAAIIVFYNKRKEKDIKSIFEVLPISVYIYFLGALGSVYSMILLPFFPIKAWSFCVSFLIITLLILLKVISKQLLNDKNCGVVVVCMVVLVLTCGGTYTDAFFTIKSAYAENKARLATIQNAIVNGDDTVKIPALINYMDNKYCIYEESGELSWNPNEWPNTAIARYYGLKEVIREDNLLKR